VNNIWNLFWIFIVIVSLLPMIQKRMMENRRLALMRKLEVKRNSRVITLIHRQETMKLIGEYPAVSILKMVKQKPIQEIEDKTLILADVAEKAIHQMRTFVTDLLAHRLDREPAERLAATLTGGQWTHDYPITSEQAKSLGLPISTDLPDEIYQLMDLFPQASAQRPSVQYIPVPYKKTTGKPAEK